MAQVSMTGEEYAELLAKIEQGAEIIRFLKEERKVKFTEDNIHTYSAGEFSVKSKFPESIHELLVRDMVDQLLHMSAEEFGLWATTDHHFYSPKQQEFNCWSQNYNVDILECSPALKERWDLAKAEIKDDIEEDINNE